MNLFEKLIMEANAVAAEIEKLKQSSAKIKEVQSGIDKMPDGKDKQEMQNRLNSTIKELSTREQKTAPKTPAASTPPPADQNQAQQPAAQSPTQQTSTQSSPQNANEKETELMKKLHGSFDPKSKTDLGKLEQLRAVQQQVGPNADMKTLSKAVYAKQYAKEDQTQPQPQAQPQAQPQTPNPQQPPLAASRFTPNIQAVQGMEAPQPKFQMEPQGQTNLAQGPTKQAALERQPQTPATTTQTAPANQQNADIPFIRDMKKIGTSLKNSVSNMYGGGNPPKRRGKNNTSSTNIAKRTTPKDNSESEEEKSKKFEYFGLNKNTVEEKNNISKFLRHLSEKNYSSAHKYLKAIVSSKINKIVSERIDKI